MRDGVNRRSVGAEERPAAKGLRLTVDPASATHLTGDALAATAANFEELEQARDELANARFRMRAILDTGGDEYLLVGRDGRIADINDIVLRALGRTRAECVGHDYRAIVGSTVYCEAAEKALRRGHAVQLETRSAFRPARSVRLTAIPDEDGLALYARDITATSRAEKEKDGWDALLHSLLDALSDRILVLDSRGIVTLASATPKACDDACGEEPALATGVHYRTTLASCFSDFSDVVFGVERILAGKGSEYRGVIPAGDGPEAPHAEVHAVRLGGPRFRAVLSWRLGESVAPGAGGRFRPERLQVAREEERRRLARELHDSLQQDLTAIDLGLQSLEGRVDDSATSDIVAELKLLVGRVHLDVRATTFLMHPPELADGGLPAALERMLNGLRRRSRLEVEYQSVAGKWKVPMRAAIALYRIAQEAMMNVYRHSRATHAVVRLFPASDHVVLDIEDNGIGFDPATAQGVGIRSMISRAREQQGSLSIERLERGTLVRVKLPIGGRKTATTAGR